ncbi:hypothetical protein ABT354_29550 [Streptomyces sp. NPDC000594]|uniref:hypothetical protein n=1 Tax=Streptomyces sp. NPDC000594 TaxID=3154261 RepID=UPI00331DCF67
MTARTVFSLAAWALAGLTATGCVTVGRAAGPPPGDGRPEPTAGARVVQGPGWEALRAAPEEGAVSSPPDSTGPQGAREAPVPPPPPPGPEAGPPAARARPAAPPAAVPTAGRGPRPAPRPVPRPRRTPPAPAVGVPPDVCGLSEGLGGWREGSTQSRFCQGMYERILGR